LNSEEIWKIQKKSKVNSEKIGKIRKKSGWWWWCWQTFVRNVIIEINNVIMKMAGKGQITSERASS
jgi:hypothetical protein